jgi:hypothetical protein
MSDELSNGKQRLLNYLVAGSDDCQNFVLTSATDLSLQVSTWRHFKVLWRSFAFLQEVM